MTEQDIQIQALSEALQAASYYIDRLETAQRRRKVGDMTEAMEHYHRVAPSLLSWINRTFNSFPLLRDKK